MAGTFSSDFSQDFGDGAIGGTLAVTEAADSISAAAKAGIGGTVSVVELPDTLGAVATTGVVSLDLHLVQAGNTLAATGTAPLATLTATLSRTQASQTIASSVDASTATKTAGLRITQDDHQLTTPALPPAYAVLSEAGGVVLSESGGIVYSEQWSPAPTTSTPNTPTVTTPLGSMISRLKAVLPTGWFPDSNTPILDGVLSGIATIWTALSDLLDYVTKQTRLATATDINLDVIASDYLGATLPRKAAETDAIYRSRIQGAIFREMGTRAAMTSSLTRLTGAAPRIFEPANATDTGGWGAKGSRLNTGMYYARAGGYGNYDLPFQAFIQAKVVATATGFGTQGYGRKGQAGLAVIGGYGRGSIQYTLLGGQQAGATDQDISDVINAVKPIGTIMWVSTEGGAAPGGPTTPPVTAAANGKLIRTQDNQTILGSTGTGTVAGLNINQANQLPSIFGTTGNVVATLARVQANQTILSTIGAGTVGSVNVTQANQTVTITGTTGNVVATLTQTQANHTVLASVGTSRVGSLNARQDDQVANISVSVGNVPLPDSTPLLDATFILDTSKLS